MTCSKNIVWFGRQTVQPYSKHFTAVPSQIGWNFRHITCSMRTPGSSLLRLLLLMIVSVFLFSLLTPHQRVISNPFTDTKENLGDKNHDTWGCSSVLFFLVEFSCLSETVAFQKPLSLVSLGGHLECLGSEMSVFGNRSQSATVFRFCCSVLLFCLLTEKQHGDTTPTRTALDTIGLYSSEVVSNLSKLPQTSTLHPLTPAPVRLHESFPNQSYL